MQEDKVKGEVEGRWQWFVLHWQPQREPVERKAWPHAEVPWFKFKLTTSSSLLISRAGSMGNFCDLWIWLEERMAPKKERRD
jgi:hypothetical protein